VVYVRTVELAWWGAFLLAIGGAPIALTVYVARMLRLR
jgi:hypothetical protein